MIILLKTKIGDYKFKLAIKIEVKTILCTFLNVDVIWNGKITIRDFDKLRSVILSLECHTLNYICIGTCIEFTFICCHTMIDNTCILEPFFNNDIFLQLSQD